MKNVNKFEEKISDLRTLRDELKIKAHLFKMDTQAEWQDLEEKWAKMGAELKPTQEAAKEALAGVGTASELLISEIAKGYNRIKDSIKQ